jgi:hypothetical protein
VLPSSSAIFFSGLNLIRILGEVRFLGDWIYFGGYGFSGWEKNLNLL